MGTSRNPSSSKPTKKESPPPPNPNPNPNPNPPPPLSMDGIEEDELLRTQPLSVEQVLKMRSRSVKQLKNIYEAEFWELAEEVRAKHRDYYWEHGKSPMEEEEEDGNERMKCGFAGCKAKAMPETRFCHSHILSDGKQTLYKGCMFITKSAQSLQITCAKPVLRAAVPCLCHVHFQKIHKQIVQALKKVGINGYSSSKTSPRFNDILASCVRETLSRRRKKASSVANKSR